jgi:hypothetical protein
MFEIGGAEGDGCVIGVWESWIVDLGMGSHSCVP